MKARHVAIGCAMAFATLSPALADPPTPPFYRAASQLAADGKLGQVILKETVTTSVPGAQAWRIAYISSDVAERKTISTAIVVAPTGQPPAAGRPIIAWAHGTTGTAQNCGPSQVIDPAAPLNQYFLVGGNSWTDYGIPAIEALISEGFVIVATDYQGLGGGGRHQYAVAGTNGRDVINSVRAAGSMNETGAGTKALVYGWSQGGGATIAAASLPDYIASKGTATDNVQFIGFIAMAPDDVAVMIPKSPADEAAGVKVMSQFGEMFSGNVFDFAHFSMNLWGTQAAFPGLNLADIFTDQSAKVLDEVLSNKCMHVVADTLNYSFGNQYKSMLRNPPVNSVAWVDAMIRGSVTATRPVAPVIIYWGTRDTTVPPVMGELYQKQMCAMGGQIERVQLPGEQTHFSTPGAATPLYLSWIRDRLAGKPLPAVCP